MCLFVAFEPTTVLYIPSHNIFPQIGFYLMMSLKYFPALSNDSEMTRDIYTQFTKRKKNPLWA